MARLTTSGKPQTLTATSRVAAAVSDALAGITPPIQRDRAKPTSTRNMVERNRLQSCFQSLQRTLRRITWTPGSFYARPVAAHMQPEAVPGRHEDSREAPVRLGHPPDRRNRRATCAMRVLMLRLDRRVGPLSGCRWFAALQIRGQGRAPHILIPRAFGVDRRRVRWIFK